VTAAADATAQRIAELGGVELRARLRATLQRRIAASPAGITLGAEELERQVADGAQRASGALWRRSLAEAATVELGISLPEAILHPAVLRAHELVGAPPYDVPAPPARLHSAPEPTPEALRLSAVHLAGIKSLRVGEDGIELRFSAAGVDLLRRPGGAGIGRLKWSEIRAVELPQGRRGIGRRRVQELHVDTVRGRASFELPGVSGEQVREYLQPMLARNRGDAETR
jgi:hypothetical protein